MTSPNKVGPYGSVRDLPSVQKLAQQLAAFKVLGILLPRDQRNKLAGLEQEYHRITDTVDSFYALLGPRNWVFTDDFNLAAIEHVIDTDDPSTAETRLLEYYKEEGRISFPMRRLQRFDAMRPRLQLLSKALDDYQAERYYAVVLVLLSVMDGFVNDQDRAARQGLHARSPEDMVAWDSVVGHHLGLSHAHETFIKGFYKTDTTMVTELYRNGIMHGMLVDFDNEIVATKAWNRLFAIADWADSRARQARPVEPEPSLMEALRGWKATQDRTTQIERWQPHEYEFDPSLEEQPEIVQICTDFLDRWMKRQWAPVGAYFIQLGTQHRSTGQLAVEAKDLFGTFELSSWTLRRVRHTAAAIAFTDVDLNVNGHLYRTALRWVRQNESKDTACEWEPGRWSLSLYGPTNYLTEENLVQ